MALQADPGAFQAQGEDHVVDQLGGADGGGEGDGGGLVDAAEKAKDLALGTRTLAEGMKTSATFMLEADEGLDVVLVPAGKA